MNVPEWLVRKWYPGWHTSGSVEALAKLAALQAEALEEYRCSHPLGKRARECKMCIAKKAGPDFKEKYE